MVNMGIFLPGTLFQFEIPCLSDAKSQTFLRGCREGHYIILDYPYYPNGMPLPLKDQMVCVIRFISQGKVYAFKSEIQKAVRYPYPFVFINYPQDLACINLRNSERYPIRIPTVYAEQVLESVSEWHLAGQMCDLSERGCLLETNRPFERETLLFLSFSLPNQESIKNLVAKVRRISTTEETYHLGLKFEGSQDSAIEKVRDYLSYLKLLQVQA